MAELKHKMMEEYLNSPIKEGDVVNVAEKFVENYSREPERLKPVKVKSIDGDKAVVIVEHYGGMDEISVYLDNIKKNTHNIGANPFKHDKWRLGTQTLNYSISSIMGLLFPEMSDFDVLPRMNSWDS